MTEPARASPGLALVRGLHTAIYLVMVAAIFALLYAGITGAHGPWLGAAAVLVLLESLVFAAAGMKCPLTAIAVKLGAAREHPADTFLPEPCTRLTLKIFGPLLLVGLTLVAARWLWLGWA